MTSDQALEDISEIKSASALSEYGRRWALDLSLLPDVDEVREAFKEKMEKLSGRMSIQD